jgi:hypothetical protein
MPAMRPLWEALGGDVGPGGGIQDARHGFILLGLDQARRQRRPGGAGAGVELDR